MPAGTPDLEAQRADVGRPLDRARGSSRRRASSAGVAASSSSALIASSVLTWSTRWMPPERSSPSGILFWTSAKTAVPTTATMMRMRQMILRSTVASASCPRAGVVLADGHAGDRALRHPDLDVFGHLEEQGLVLHRGHRAVDPASGNHPVTLLETRDHRVLLLLLLLGRQDDDEVEDREDQYERHEHGQGVAPGCTSHGSPLSVGGGAFICLRHPGELDSRPKLASSGPQ